ncbi:MAG: SAM-dependent chlorinase/fluorinase [Gammaproteobacteria bacterium]|nr:SAM-dependent chlorinase/fluorinase [Gammaproteobacteria bacterium]
MIVLFTDFGLQGPYIGQMQAVLARLAPSVPVINLFADAPTFRPQAAAYLLAAYVDELPAGTVFLCVVDPGVGTTQRKPVVYEIGERWFVGPDNGLFDVVIARSGQAVTRQEILWQPPKLSASFHGRDLFAPVGARLALGELPAQWLGEAELCSAKEHCPLDLDAVIYIDGFGNAMTGRRAATVNPQTRFKVNGRELGWARTFGVAAEGEPFWYENSNGLVEIAVNCGSAAAQLDLHVGTVVRRVL